jgi:hypothetical protein
VDGRLLLHFDSIPATDRKKHSKKEKKKKDETKRGFYAERDTLDRFGCENQRTKTGTENGRE